jgi:membrane protein YdbS with pleckstrin-like domain
VAIFVFRDDLIPIVYVKYIAGLVIVLLLILAICDLIIIQRTIYIVKTEQIIIVTGVLLKRTDYIEMYRIYDYKHEQTLIDQLFGLMTVKIISRDISHPVLIMRGIINNPVLIDEIRKRVEKQKAIKNVHEINN